MIFLTSSHLPMLRCRAHFVASNIEDALTQLVISNYTHRNRIICNCCCSDRAAREYPHVCPLHTFLSATMLHINTVFISRAPLYILL